MKSDYCQLLGTGIAQSCRFYSPSYTLAVLDSQLCPAVSCVRRLLPLLFPTLLREKSNRPQSRRVRRGTEGVQTRDGGALLAVRRPQGHPPARRRPAAPAPSPAEPGRYRTCAARCRRAEEIPRVDVTRGQGAFRCIEHESEAPGRCRAPWAWAGGIPP
jgi:hypothetical protein